MTMMSSEYYPSAITAQCLVAYLKTEMAPLTDLGSGNFTLNPSSLQKCKLEHFRPSFKPHLTLK